MANLIVLTGKHKGKKIALPEKEVIFGRDEGCFIRLASTDVSRQHCALIPTPKGLLVRDLGSQNGTIVNNALIEHETLLRPGDFIQIGTVQFQLEGARQEKPKGLDIDIAEWLSESDTSTDIPVAADTTILKSHDWHPVPKPDPKTQYVSVAEEAREIIRRHLKSLNDS